MSATNNWYVLTGGPSCGKTTLLTEFDKLGFKTVPEAARAVIDEARAKGIAPEVLRADEESFQHSVAAMKVKLEAALSKDVVTIFDRGMHDSWAYLKYYGYELADWEREIHEAANYRKIFLLEPLATYEEDYARTESTDFAGKIHDLLQDTYNSFGMPPVLVPAMSVAERMDFIQVLMREADS